MSDTFRCPECRLWRYCAGSRHDRTDPNDRPGCHACSYCVAHMLTCEGSEREAHEYPGDAGEPLPMDWRRR